eukprot:symbB.v1.2.012814.t1/scaffold884.1/size313170/26
MENNTAPIRFHLNFDTLYEDKVQASPFTKDRYCFREGDWFRIGYPGCGDRTTTAVTGNKWCLCTSNDIITEQMRDFVIHATTEVMKEVPQFIAVMPLEDALKFRNFEGSYPAMWQTTGQTGECCDADCQKGLHVVVPESLCTTGIDADAVMSVSMPPPLPGVGGAGTFCSADQHGRPAHLVFQWHRRVTVRQFSSLSTEELVQTWRGLVLHEAFHGLGFGSGLWRNRYDASGQRREIIKQLEVEDEDGTTDFIYHFVKGTRTYDVAKTYFGCEEEDKWQGLPLMSWPPSGRDTHHETRVLRDDVMSYGDGLEAVSAVTLAALEDTGHYLANYSAAECMWWGKGRGCGFVLRRCTARPEGEVVTGNEASSHCDRTWSSRYSSGNREALEKCIQPFCQSRSALGVTTCDVECFTGEDATATCRQVVPAAPVEAAGVVGWAEDLAQQIIEYDVTLESVKNVATMSMAPLCFLSVCWVAKCMFCPGRQDARMRLLFYMLAGISLLPGVGIIAFGVYVALNWPEFQVFFTVEFIAGVQTMGLAVFFITGFGIFAVYTGHRGKQLCFCVLRTLEVLTLLGTAGLAVHSSGSHQIPSISRCPYCMKIWSNLSHSMSLLAWKCVQPSVAYRTTWSMSAKSELICSQGDSFFGKSLTASDGSKWLCNEANGLFLPLVHPETKKQMFEEQCWECVFKGTVKGRKTPEISDVSETMVKSGTTISALCVPQHHPHPGWLLEAENKLYYPMNHPDTAAILFKPKTSNPTVVGHVVNANDLENGDVILKDDDPTCQQVAAGLSLCIPLVGCITFCATAASSPEGSKRRKWGNIACAVASCTFSVALLVQVINYNSLS